MLLASIALTLNIGSIELWIQIKFWVPKTRTNVAKRNVTRRVVVCLKWAHYFIADNVCVGGDGVKSF